MITTGEPQLEHNVFFENVFVSSALVSWISFFHKMYHYICENVRKRGSSVFVKWIGSPNLLVRAMFVNTNCSFLGGS
jgi:predicted transcriptional regulator